MAILVRQGRSENINKLPIAEFDFKLDPTETQEVLNKYFVKNSSNGGEAFGVFHSGKNRVEATVEVNIKVFENK